MEGTVKKIHVARFTVNALHILEQVMEEATAVDIPVMGEGTSLL